MMVSPEIENAIYLVSTPIGTLSDFTFKGLNLLKKVDVLIAEDTRVLRHLMRMYDIATSGRRILSYNDHSSEKRRTEIVNEIKLGKSAAYFSDAGTPLISDPGFKLVDKVINEGLKVRVAPGASSMLAAVCLSGLPTDRFLFNGFVPSKKTARLNLFKELSSLPFTLIFLESPKRLVSTLDDMVCILGEDRHGAVCREITKLHEEVVRDRLYSLKEFYSKKTSLKGEIVIVLKGYKKMTPEQTEIDKMILKTLKEYSLKDASDRVSHALSLPRNLIYKRALNLKKGK